MSFENLVMAVRKGAEEALQLQKGVRGNHKDDGTIITEADMMIHRLLKDHIRRFYPQEAFLSEEEVKLPALAPGRLLFVLDPIDGTDAYSQGMPGWCVALGILDTDLTPVGGIIYAPRWSVAGSEESLLVLEPGEAPTLNGEPMIPPDRAGSLHCQQIMTSSRIHRRVDLSAYPGKVRSIGSSILHLAAPLLYPGVTASLQAAGYIWDIAASHAFLLALGYQLEYLSGGSLDYRSLVRRKKTRDILLSGTPEALDTLRRTIRVLKPHDGRAEG
ncbi:MAG: inositol monophosphatase [Spirochaetales bacterium]|nr:inositol monophosphatase [Spirochaetales bacterium]